MSALASIVRIAQSLSSSILNYLAPWRCMLCGAFLPTDVQWHYLCRRCFDSLEPAPPPHELLAIAEAQSGDPDLCPLSCVMARWSAHPSDEHGLFRLIYALKYYGYWRIGVELGIELGAMVKILAPTCYDTIVPVPIHRARRRERGYNQADAIAEGMQRVLRIPVLHDAIRRTRYTQSQSKLGALERRTNTEGAFGGGSQAARLRGCTILLVDDVFTTGSTLRSVATCALELGARRTDAATLVATRL